MHDSMRHAPGRSLSCLPLTGVLGRMQQTADTAAARQNNGGTCTYRGAWKKLYRLAESPLSVHLFPAFGVNGCGEI